MTPETYKRWRLGLGFVTAKELANYLNMAPISISTYESRGSGAVADAKLMKILEEKILNGDDEFVNSVIEMAQKCGKISLETRAALESKNRFEASENKSDFYENSNVFDINSLRLYTQALEEKISNLESRISKLEPRL